MGCLAYTYSPTLEPKIKRFKKELTLAESKKKAQIVYLYGFNGQEKTDELKGSGNHYTAPYWEYDPRAVHRWNIDPKWHPSFSPYSIMQGNPILYSDPMGDTIKTTQEGFNIINEGLTATLGENHGFSFQDGVMTYSKPENAEYNDTQQEIVDKYVALIGDERTVNVNVVDFDEKFDATGRGNFVSLKELGLSGGTRRPDGQQVWLARDPKVRTSEGYADAPFSTRGIASLHEIGGHSYLRLYLPKLEQSTHNKLTEDFETRFRQIYRINDQVNFRQFKRASKRGRSPWFKGGEALPHD